MDEKRRRELVSEAIGLLYGEVSPDAGNAALGWQQHGSDCSYRVGGADTVRWFLREFTPRFDDLAWIASQGYNLDDSDSRVSVQQLASYYSAALDEAGEWVYISRSPR